MLENDERLPYSFYLNNQEISEALQTIVRSQKLSPEDVLPIVYRPQAVFRVNAVARCSSSLPGHTEAVLHVSFSSDGRHLASGSGDATVRIWDVDTETPKLTLSGHKNWVLAVAWSGCGKKLASGGMDCTLRVWDPSTGKLLNGKIRQKHIKPITAIVWEPVMVDPSSRRLATASQDNTIVVWDTVTGVPLFSFSGHTQPVQALKWGGQGLIYSGSRDRSVRAWSLETKRMFRLMEAHAHWVNTLSLNCDYVLRQGPYDHRGMAPTDRDEIQQLAKEKYESITNTNGELLVSGSDDFTLRLWNPMETGKPIHTMTGHQQPVNYVLHSPDGLMIASASFDKSVRIWDGITGKFLYAFRAHVQSVYQVAWSADSRWVVSSSKDSTLKLWSIQQKKMIEDLPGHADEVFAVDWSPDGLRVASGGKDRILKIWRS